MRVRIIVALFTVVLSLIISAAHAAVPTTLIPIQGRVTDAGGVPLAPGVKSFVFRIFNASAGGIQIWPAIGGEAQSISTNADGLWTGQLGAVNPLTDVIFADSVRWLEVTVNDLTLSPRIRLLTGPYAMRVATVDGATGGQVSGKITTTGIGDGVEIQGPGIGNANEAYIRFADQNGTQFGYVGDANPGNPDMYVVSHTGSIHLYTAGGIALTAGSSGTVGIGAEPTGHKLFVQTSGPSAVYGYSTGLNGTGLIGSCNDGAGAFGVWGASSSGYAGNFDGNVDVDGTLSKNAGSFKIDHPLDPANKYLSHSFVESPDMMNIYNGNATLDAQGEAAVTLPDWFEALNRDLRYQLTAIGAPGPNLYIAQEVTNNQFRIAGGAPGMRVSWMVTGIRQDVYANAHRIPVEELKPGAERGFYRNPELFDQPEEKGIDWARHPVMMKQMKDEREKAKADSK